jgi:hypothetical protein
MLSAIYWLPVIEAALLLLLCVLLVRKYADMQRTDYFTIFLVIIGWFMAFSMIFAIPMDLYIVSVRID